jgi:hypothetical protein
MIDALRSPIASPERARARWRSKRTAVIVLALMGVLIAGGVFLGRYQPLSSGGLALADPSPTFAIPWAEGSASDHGIPVYRVTYREDQILRYGFFLRNEGPIAVTVTSLQAPANPGDLFMLEPAGTAVGDGAPTASVDASRIAPFQPFSLGPSEVRWVVLEWRFLHCGAYGDGTSSTFFGTDISYGVLGFTHHVSLNLPIPVEVPAPPRSSCPSA